MTNYNKYAGLFSNLWHSIEAERPSWEYMKKYLNPGCVFFDIGCRKGIYTQAVNSYLNNECEIHSFDALSHPEMENISNNYKNIFFNDIALGDGKISECVIHVATNTKLKVNTITLDNYIIDNEIKNIDFIKMDVDGFQNIIIDNSDYTLKTFRPCMMIEFNTNFTNSVTNPSQYLNLLYDKNSIDAFNIHANDRKQNTDNDIKLIEKLKLYGYGLSEVRNGNNLFFEVKNNV